MEIEDVARIVWKDCIGAKPAEKAIIVSDAARPSDPRYRISRVLWETGRGFCKDCAIIMMKKTGMHGREPPADVADAMLGADIVIAPTEHSITHTEAAANAAERGARIATMPGITEGIFMRAVPLDYKKLDAVCGALKGVLADGRRITVTTGKGTDMSMEIVKGRKVCNGNGILKPGKIKNLPDGEVSIAPKEGSANGVAVFDLSSMDKKLKKPFRVVVKDGFAVGCGNRALWKAISAVKAGTNMAELGIGTNPKARITGSILEDEKVLGTAHIAFGTNKDLGGTVQTSVHLDSVFARPTIEVDGRVIVSRGRFLFL